MLTPTFTSKVLDFLNQQRVWILFAVAGLLFVNLAWVIGTYLIYPGYLDHGEPSVALISWRLLEGFPAFPGFGEPAMVSNVYGPLTYVMHAVWFWFLGPSVMSGKAASLLAALLVPVFVFLSHRAKGFEAALIGAILAAGLVALHIPYSIWNRPDSFIALLVVIAVWAANDSDPDRLEWKKSAIIGLCGGLAVGMKIHAGVFFVPIAIFHCLNGNHGIKAFSLIAAVGLAAVLLPFALPVFPASNYLEWFGHFVGKENPAQTVLRVVRYGLIYVTPMAIFLAARRWSRKRIPLAEKAYFWLYIISLVVILYPATKVGAGAHYFFPFLAIFIDQVLRHAHRVKKHRPRMWFGIGAVAAVILVLGIPVQKRFYRALHWEKVEAIQAEIRTIMAKHPDKTIEMGVGQNTATYPRTFYKTLLVLKGHPYTIDAAPAMEMTMMKIPLNDDLLSLLRGCSTDLWLIPKGEKPFAMTGYYGTPTVGQAFIDTFNASYAKAESLDHFDIWACEG
ncbi:MAG: hypothetical protein V3U48_09245 [Rhodospirillales bacterium]